MLHAHKVYSFSLLYNILLFTYNRIYLSIVLLMGIGVASSLGLLYQ